MKILFTTLAAVLATVNLAVAASAQHVVIIGVDGMSPDGIQKASTPVMDTMMKSGAFSLHARGVMPTSSSPNWASMIMGAGPEQHGVTSNDWQIDKFQIAPTAVEPGGRFPTIFHLLHEQKPESTSAVFHDWDGFGRLFNRTDVNIVEHPDGPAKTTEAAAAYIRSAKPTFTFVHLDHVDHAGHESGHGTPQYYAAVEEADRYIGEILQAVRDAGIKDETTIIVTADHGGVGKGHGGATMAEIEIPWIIVGPGVKEGHEISDPINTYDTAATVAYLFGLKPHPAWIGKPVADAFR